MFSRLVLMVLVMAAQLAGAARFSAGSAAETSACGAAALITHKRCCGEGCQCTPDSCPCARPAEPSEQAPMEAPAPVPAQRIDLHHGQTVIAIPRVAGALPARRTATIEFAPSLQRPKFRATLGIWTT